MRASFQPRRRKETDGVENHPGGGSVIQPSVGACGLRHRNTSNRDGPCSPGNGHACAHPAGVSITGHYAANTNTDAFDYKDTCACYTARSYSHAYHAANDYADTHHTTNARADGNTYSGTRPGADSDSDAAAQADRHTGSNANRQATTDPNASPAQSDYESGKRRRAGAKQTAAGITNHAIALDCRWR